MSGTYTIYTNRRTTFLTLTVFGNLFNFYPFWMFDRESGYSAFHFEKHKGFTIHLGLFGLVFLPYKK